MGFVEVGKCEYHGPLSI